MSAFPFLRVRRPWEDSLYPEIPPAPGYTTPESYDAVLRRLLGMTPAPDLTGDVSRDDGQPPPGHPTTARSAGPLLY